MIPGAFRASAAALGLLAAATTAHAAHRLPFRAAVLLTWGEGAGSDAFRADLGRALTQSLAGTCFAGVELADDDPAASHADLLLAATLSNVYEELRFQDSIAGALQPGEPASELRRVARFEVTVDATLQTLAGRVPVGHKHLVVSISRQPTYVGEDPQATARARAIERIVSDLTKAFCRGGAKQEDKIRAALAGPPGDPPSPR